MWLAFMGHWIISEIVHFQPHIVFVCVCVCGNRTMLRERSGRGIFRQILTITRASYVALTSGKESTSQCKRHGFHPWVRKIPWSRKWQPTPVFLPGKSHGHRSLVGQSPCAQKELDTTEQTCTALRSGLTCRRPSRPAALWNALTWSDDLRGG